MVVVIKVLKFGGSVLVSGSDYLRATREVKKVIDQGYNAIVVVSAMKDVTDELLKILQDPLNWYGRVKELYEKHVEALKEIKPNEEVLTKVFTRLSIEFDELVKVMHAISITHEVTPRLKDYVSSFGEKLSTILMWSALNREGVESSYLIGRDAGIITDDNFGEAKPVMELTRKSVCDVVSKYLNSGITPVITGFIAGTVDGRITTLGRGGSDYTATLIASLVNAEEVILYTDVPGILTGDPKFMRDVKLIKELSYEEAMACAQLGTKRLHPRTFEPVKETNVNTSITCMGCDEKTIISKEESEPPVKIVTLVHDFSLIILKGVALTKLSNVINILSMLSSKDVNIISLMQQPAQSITSLIVKKVQLGEVLNIVNEMRRLEVIDDFNYMTGISMISVIGHGLKDPSVLGYLLSDVVDTPIYGILRSPQDVNLSIIVNTEDSIRLAIKLHDRMISKWWS